MKKFHRLVVVLVLALGIAAPAAAHNKIAPFAPAIDLRDEIAAPNDVQPLPVFVGTSAFDEVAHIELPSPSIVDELAHRFAAADVESPSDLAIFDRTVSRKLASGPLAVFEENNVKGVSELGLIWRRGVEFQALPFSEPATGLVYARARWYDPSTGSFLSPDPMGYRDSSNLYAFAGGDPVNGRDPTGEHVRRTISVNGMPVVIDAPTLEEMNEGDFSLGVSYTPTGETEAVHHLFDSAQGADLVVLAKVNAPMARAMFEQFYGVSIDQVEYSGLRAWGQSFRANAPNLALATLGTIAAIAPAPRAAPTPRIKVNLARSTPQVRQPVAMNLVPLESEQALAAARSSPKTYYSYRELRAQINQAGLSGRGEGLEAHHLLEKRFASRFGIAEDDVISAPVTPSWHRNVGRMGANLDRQIMGELQKMGVQTPGSATVEQIWQAHKRVYVRVGQREWADAIYKQYFQARGVNY